MNGASVEATARFGPQSKARPGPERLSFVGCEVSRGQTGCCVSSEAQGVWNVEACHTATACPGGPGNPESCTAQQIEAYPLVFVALLGRSSRRQLTQRPCSRDTFRRLSMPSSLCLSRLSYTQGTSLINISLTSAQQSQASAPSESTGPFLYHAGLHCLCACGLPRLASSPRCSVPGRICHALRLHIRTSRRVPCGTITPQAYAAAHLATTNR